MTEPTDAAHRPNVRAYRAAVVSFVIATAGGIAAAIGYGTDNTGDLLGLGLAAALFGIGFGLVCWAKYLDFDEHAVQEREHLVTTPEAKEELHEELQTTGAVLGRRRMLLGLIGVLVRQPGRRLRRADRVARSEASGRAGADVVAPRLAAGLARRHADRAGVADLRPARHGVPRRAHRCGRLAGRAAADAAQQLTQRTIDGGALDGWVAYSKICTHAGCSVGLFGVDNRRPDTLRQLVCPCHQSVFDPVNGAEPVGGPATRSLPQLPLDVDADGFLVAKAPFDRVVGPVTWNEA